MSYYQIISSPLGKIIIVEQDECLIRLEFIESASDLQVSLSSSGQKKWTPFLREVRKQLAHYFSGRRHDFDVPISLEGTSFRQKAWKALCQIPYGQTRTYSEQARMIGNQRACRAIGQANHHNPIAIVVPCHRVVGSGGDLTGYASGVERKRWLLEHERSIKEKPTTPIIELSVKRRLQCWK